MRNLDALHLALALNIGTPMLATADPVMAAAASTMGFEVARF